MALVGLGILLAAAFVPPLLYVLWIRAHEEHEREPLGRVLRVFVAGGVVGVGLAIVFSLLLDLQMRPAYEATALAASYATFAAVAIAPLAEEPAKALCVLFARDRHPEPEDGLVYGAAAGLGFAATENLLYESVALASGGLGAYVATSAIRSVASALLHASASAWAGYGLLAWRTGHGSAFAALGWLVLAVAAHAAFNLLASFGLAVALALAIALALVAFRMVRRRVLRLDAVRSA
ncbi:MAG TPA: PrsW family glutamic-type intramembrane protease [Candidatus Thermoplasmatota archaeon]|nr:PrsW family glutamic-type intramembrane protease [Candidatus Thermoplasmatota archaeon]